MERDQSVLQSVWDGIKSAASAVWNGMKSVIIEPVKAITEKVTSAFEGMKGVYWMCGKALKQGSRPY
ncbi:hypothetical protein P7H21_23740 [Paenibacillus larvae]|nr:hypothetical protein [Paenibacillus larvae]MDT2306358.1 hypothetical protein [Paenibacillus larvae]